LVLFLAIIFCFLVGRKWEVRSEKFVLGSKIERQSITINRLNLPATSSVKISASIGGYLFDIEGLTSPKAKVEFYSTENISVFTTIADESGVFRFNSLLLPVQTGDFCFLSYDTEGMANNPLCFAPPPIQTRTQISGIVLSPSFSLNKGIFRQNEQVTAQGRTFPNASLQVFFFERELNPFQEFFDVIIPSALAEGITANRQPTANNQKASFKEQILSKGFLDSPPKYKIFGGSLGMTRGRVYAREGPSLILNADDNGNFAFNLPTQKSTSWRVFVGPKLEDAGFTAKSNTLEFSALSWWQWFLTKVLKFLTKVLAGFFKIVLRWETLMAMLLGFTGVLVWKIKRQKDQGIRNKGLGIKK